MCYEVRNLNNDKKIRMTTKAAERLLSKSIMMQLEGEHDEDNA